MKLTGWYKGRQKPVRVGWYERSYNSKRPSNGEARRHFWDGQAWYLADNSEGRLVSLYQGLPWRGRMK